METRHTRKLTFWALLLLAGGLFAGVGWLASRPITTADSPPPTEAATSPATGHEQLPRNIDPGDYNVVIFLIDTLRADRVGAYGYDKPTTPHMDALAAQGVVFEQCSAPAPWTLPSVVSLLTSTFPGEHRVLVDGQRVNASIEPLAVRLKKAGYTTASFHANAYAGPMSGLDRGYDLAQSHRYVNGRLVDAWLETVGGRPFHLYIHNIEPHNPYQAPGRLVQLFGSVSDETRQAVRQHYLHYRKLTRADFAAGRPLGTTDNSAEQESAMRTLATMKADIDVLYDAVVRQADQRLGSVIEVLKRRGLWDDTLFVVTADHGEELGDHGGWQHDHSVYEELIRVPLIVHLPGGRFAGQRVGEVVSLVDLLPTIFDVLGRSEAASECRGTSLLPLLTGGRLREPGELALTAMRINRKKYYRPFAEARGDTNLVVRQGRFKGIWNAEPQTLELYDLDADPFERSNLTGQRPDMAESMEQFARAWLRTCGRDAPQQPTTRPAELDDKTLDNLRSLGYVE